MDLLRVPNGIHLPNICLKCADHAVERRTAFEIEIPLCLACATRWRRRNVFHALIVGGIVVAVICAVNGGRQQTPVTFGVMLMLALSLLITYRYGAVVLSHSDGQALYLLGVDAKAKRLIEGSLDPSVLAKGTPQLVGRRCVCCDKRITIQADGTTCDVCDSPLHRDECADEHASRAHREESGIPYR